MTSSPADPTVFEDTDRQAIEITEGELLGEHTYHNVLYTGPPDVVDVFTDSVPDNLDRSVDEARQFANSTTAADDAPRVAKRVPPEQAVEMGSPYLSSAFFHMDMTGGYDWHTIFRRAWDSPHYAVSFTADYNTGTLSITVSLQ